jgi:hypothetical protein
MTPRAAAAECHHASFVLFCFFLYFFSPDGSLFSTKQTAFITMPPRNDFFFFTQLPHAHFSLFFRRRRVFSSAF